MGARRLHSSCNLGPAFFDITGATLPCPKFISSPTELTREFSLKKIINIHIMYTGIIYSIGLIARLWKFLYMAISHIHMDLRRYIHLNFTFSCIQVLGSWHRPGCCREVLGWRGDMIITRRISRGVYCYDQHQLRSQEWALWVLMILKWWSEVDRKIITLVQ